MTTIRLTVKHNRLCFPSGGADFDKPGYPASPDVPCMLYVRYPSGDFDTIPYPFPSYEADELRKRLASALFDERECNEFFPDDAIIELPDGTVFDFDSILAGA